ncbi:TRAP transporter small permease subunit [Jannaschia aquimarina]|uniref:TRAP transporter small permease protein n=1 Tax=Jannaschia aquimarina TaxID=935700 RepID=A0A0D1EIC4_9RHOB|nr:TRAP transporter small permease [Jannaschia aquimarina]KIT17344.1 Tripartite ATP-independent periplasmic transporter, DctQ component [Jannaschia aquimarina]SNT20628.1 TRAP-type C4-dicarboxylate transport system, small permease component [Jannaschia aquimarina]
MATTSSVLTDGTRLSRTDRALLRLESLLNLAAGITIFALVLLAIANVLMRKLLNAPVPGYIDWTEQFMAIFAFLGLAYVQREGGHIRMDLLVGSLKGRVLWLFEFVSVLLMLLVVTALIYGTWFHFDRSFDFNAPNWSTDSSIDIALPLWPAKLAVPIAFAILWLRLILQLWAYGRALRTGDPRPVAVPLPEDPAEQASKEAASVAD